MIAPDTENPPGKEINPSTVYIPKSNPAALPARIPQDRAVIRCIFIVQRTMITTGTTSMTRLTGLAVPAAAGVTAPSAVVLENSRNNINAPAAAGRL
jgi:hypothetical protein